jgi:hypothetical protein
MRRDASLFAVLVLLVASMLSIAPGAQASGLVLAQETDEGGDTVGETDAGGEETTGTQEDEGAGGEAAESGAGGESEGAAAETGPPWTYQMAWMSAVLVLLLGVFMVFKYYRFVIQRSRGRT